MTFLYVLISIRLSSWPMSGIIAPGQVRVSTFASKPLGWIPLVMELPIISVFFFDDLLLVCSVVDLIAVLEFRQPLDLGELLRTRGGRVGVLVSLSLGC